MILLLVLTLTCSLTVQAKGEEIIHDGVYAESVDLAGKTKEQATEAIEAYVEELKNVTISFLTADGTKVPVRVGELGIDWINHELVEEAVKLGCEGNVIQRYKALKDLEYENQIYELQYAFDRQAISDILTDRCTQYDQKAVNAALIRENDAFRIVDGQQGVVLDVEASADKIYDYLVNDWQEQDAEIELVIITEEPERTADELEQVQDLLGSFTTSYSTSGSSRRANVENGCRLIDKTTLYPGEEFSTYSAVSPFSEDNGYYMAGSYLNGKVVDSLGGGICQVSTTLYNAVLRSELEVTERHNHSMIVSYVDPSADAAISESSGKDFKFVNNLDYPIYIEGYTSDCEITFNIYGKETRDAGRQVTYESQILEENKPESDAIYADSSHAIGYIATDSAHIGYKAKLWKVVTENGVEVSRTEVNSSSYKMVPRSATVGVATDNAQAHEEIMAAIGTGNLDHVKNVINTLTTQTKETPETGEE